jgi:hypothetical protein
MNEEKQQKIGAGHLDAMLRAGAKELSQILPAFPESCTFRNNLEL